MKKYQHLIYFLSCIIVPYLIFRLLGVDRTAQEDGNIFLLLVPLLFGFYQFINSIVQIFEKRYFDAKCSFLKFILFVSIFIKLNYTYYNFLMLFLIIIFIAVFILKNAWSHNSRSVILGLLIINTSLLFTPDSSILFFFNINRQKWHHISLYEFKNNHHTWLGQSDSTHAAVIDMEYKWKLNRIYNYPPAIVIAIADPDSSWVVPVMASNATTLQHEQFHLDILEYYKILIQDSLNKCWGCKYIKKQSILDYYLGVEIKMQHRFDTSFTLNDKQDLDDIRNLIRQKIN